MEACRDLLLLRFKPHLVLQEKKKCTYNYLTVNSAMSIIEPLNTGHKN